MIGYIANMKVSIHQPSFLPWAGYIHKLASSDVFLSDSNFQFSPNEMYHRTYIKDQNRELKYLTVPIDKSNGTAGMISQIKLRDTVSFADSLRNNLIWYKKNEKCVNWKLTHDLFLELIDKLKKNEYTSLLDLIEASNKVVLDYLDLSKKYRSDVTHPHGYQKTEQLIQIINQNIKDDDIIYLSGSGGRHYLDVDLMKQSNIRVKFQTISEKVYKGSVLDYLFLYEKDEILPIINKEFSWEK